MIRLILAFLLVANLASAEEKVVAGLSQSLVSITANFDGTGILIFGAVKRDAPAPDTGPLEVVIAVTGPATPVVVRRKSKEYGIWVNTASVEVDRAPSFYAVASTSPLRDVLSEIEDRRYKITIDRLIRSVGVAREGLDAASFSEAVIRIRQDKGLYTEVGGDIELTDETLFRTQIALPSNLVEGDYSTRIFLTRDKKVVDAFETTLAVRKVGLERWIYNLAHQKPLIYAILSLTIAIAAGWTASAVFRLLRLN